jgi:hypothetical protein
MVCYLEGMRLYADVNLKTKGKNIYGSKDE